MIGIDKSSKKLKYNRQKQKNNSVKGVSVFAVLSIAIGGTVLGLLYQKCCSEIRNIIINNAKDFDEDRAIDEDIDSDIYDEINEEINIKRDEIKQTLKNKTNKPIGNVGSAMKEALEDLETEEKDENEDKE